ncbi:hypothetical protein PTSG_11351 [Salpingoeca rosetta]|uniref:BRCT domain-containing protein n=1 Tax=Salpingoeca rosetta (strain ATCC 50818 / BSB-021) TaxID=946362 RepID=F2UT56_SALR5|nr:uncharacterized protein PTSG_11351 [Salpingoeca rosetta]EGD81315.1 hypothetical protein PTSG_11351 [Salpingoeca rosetta]|eukprot:XP_004987711.1 hypothetical protein PTSG_11351 [Salpingoeca rosetta]
MEAWERDRRAVGVSLPISPYISGQAFLRGLRIGLHQLTAEQLPIVWAMARTSGATVVTSKLQSCDVVLSGAPDLHHQPAKAFSSDDEGSGNNEAGIDDVRQLASKHGIPVVSPHWLVECSQHRRKVDDRPYHLVPVTAKRRARQAPRRRRQRRQDDEDEDEDEDEGEGEGDEGGFDDGGAEKMEGSEGEAAPPQRRVPAKDRVFLLHTGEVNGNSHTRATGTSATSSSSLMSLTRSPPPGLDGVDVQDASTWAAAIASTRARVMWEDCSDVTHCITTKLDGTCTALEGRGVTLVSPYWTRYARCLPGVDVDPACDILFRPVTMKTGAEPTTVSVTGFVELERQYVIDLVLHAQLQYRGALKRSTNVLVCKHAAGDKFRFAQERDVPCVHIGWLLDTLAMGEKQPFYPYKMTSDAPSSSTTAATATSSAPGDVVTIAGPPLPSWVRNQANQQLFKQHKHIPQPLPAPGSPQKSAHLMESAQKTRNFRVAFTSVPPVDKPELIKEAREMKLKVVQAPRCTHLIVGTPTRTSNFLRALCVCDYVVRVSWLHQSHSAGYLLPEIILSGALHQKLSFDAWRIYKQDA